MNIDEFETLLDNCSIMLNSDDRVVFKPLSFRVRKKVNQILKNNNMENLSQEEFAAIAQEHHPLYQARKKIKAQKAQRFSTLSTQEVADLPLEKKLEYMEIIFPTEQKSGEFIELFNKCEDNIRTCLFNMDFPPGFWEREKKSAERFASLIASDPEITDAIKYWQQTSLAEKQFIVQQAGKAFEYIYGIPVKITFFTEEEERARKCSMGMSKDVHINAAYYSEGKLHFNLDRLNNSDNFFAVSTLFHEGTHLRQDCETFEDPLVDRIFSCNINYASIYDDMISNKQAATYKDLYATQPGETHAYGLQEYVEELLAEKIGIEKTHYTDLEKETKNIHNKAFTMAKITQYRSSQK